MITRHSPGAAETYRREAWPYQRTFQTDLKRLPVFTAALLAGAPPPTSATVTVEAVVFTPRTLDALLAGKGKPAPDLGAGWSITAPDSTDAKSLLEACLADWLDFWWAPSSQDYLIYADHDEYTTVFARSPSPLSAIAAAMEEAGFAEVADWQRTF